MNAPGLSFHLHLTPAFVSDPAGHGSEAQAFSQYSPTVSLNTAASEAPSNTNELFSDEAMHWLTDEAFIFIFW